MCWQHGVGKTLTPCPAQETETQHRANRATSAPPADQGHFPLQRLPLRQGPRVSAVAFAGYGKEDSASPSLTWTSYSRTQDEVVSVCMDIRSACMQGKGSAHFSIFCTQQLYLPLRPAQNSQAPPGQKSCALSRLQV